MTSDELLVKRGVLCDNIKVKRKKLKPMSSYDSEFWSTQAEICKLEQERLTIHSQLEYHEYVECGVEVSRKQWEESSEKAIAIANEYQAHRVQESIANKQAERLGAKNPERFLRAAFVKLFNSSRIGFNIAKTSKGRRDTGPQSSMRNDMEVRYNAVQTGVIWEPVLHFWVDKYSVNAAHLFPWRCADSMDAIFGEGSQSELFSAVNGLFLHKEIEAALDKGVIAIVPDVDLEPDESLEPSEDKQNRQQRLRDWEQEGPHNYKTIILDWNYKDLEEPRFSKSYPVETLKQLHNRPLQFNNDFRPRSRYVWWTFLNAITQLSWRQKEDDKTAIQKEVRRSTRYWGTRGRYVKKNQILGFIEELGQDVESIAETILENAIEEQGHLEPDPTAIAVMSSEIIRKGKERDKNNDNDSEDEDDEDGEDEPRYD
jgi:hypothetical protein